MDSSSSVMRTAPPAHATSGGPSQETATTEPVPPGGAANSSGGEGQPIGRAGSAGVARFTDADSDALLERLQDSPLLAEGKINLVSLEAIADKMGTKWSLRSHLVHDHFERAVARHNGPAGIAVRLSDTEYLVAHADATRLAGHMTCMHALRETLTHFLGEARSLDIVVHKVTRLSKDAVFGERLDVGAVELDAAAEERNRSAEQAPPTFAFVWSPFTASDGRNLNVACELDPVLHLKTLKMIGHRVTRDVFDTETDMTLSEADLDLLRRVDIERIDFATLQRAIARLRSAGDEKDPTLILPVSITALSSQKARTILSDLFKEAQSIVQHGLITEIYGIEGVPSGRLLEGIAFVKPYSLYVIGRLGGFETSAPAMLKHTGLQGLSFECPPRIEGAEYIEWLRQRRNILRSVKKSGLAYGLPVLLDHALAGALGITHGSLRRGDASGGYQEQRGRVDAPAEPAEPAEG